MKKQYQPPDTPRPGHGGGERFDSLFEHARRDAFTQAETERLWQNVVSTGPGGGEAGPEIPEGGMRGWGSGALLKATAAFVVAGGLLLAAMAMRKPGAQAPIMVANGPPPTASGLEAPRGAEGPPVVSWEDLPRAQKPSQGETRPLTPPAPRGRSAPAPPAAETGSAAEPAPVVAASPTEGALLLRARQELASDPASALELTDEAARRFPEGTLSPEREVLAIEALARLGHFPSARARFAAFRARYPQSPHLARLESLLTL